MNKLVLCAALAAAITTSVAVQAMEKASPKKEKCYGVAKAGKNDCASADGVNGCAGQSTRDNNANDWKYVAKGTCVELKGSLTAPKK